MSVYLKVTRNAGETPREMVKRIASKSGLEIECLEAFDADIKGGTDPMTAAWGALYEWDCEMEIEVGGS